MRRVVVTGVGIVSPLGCGSTLVWNSLTASKSGIVSLKDRMFKFPNSSESTDWSSVPSQVAGLVPHGSALNEFDMGRYFDKSEEKRQSPFINYGIAAAVEALNDACWKPESQEDKDRTGVCMGSGIGCIDEIALTARSFLNQGMKKVSPYFVPRILVNMASGHISIKYGFRGPNHSASTACTTGAHAIGDASRFIQFGDADVMVAGGTESSVSPFAMAGARALSTKYNNSPSEASRPFDRDRDGFVIGEGAGAIILEEYNHAKKRGAQIYAEIRGYGVSGDAFHMTSPPEDGSGAILSMKRALSHAQISPNQVDYLNAHATSTGLGDIVETRAIKSIFGDKLSSPYGKSSNLAVSSTKGATGHLLGAAGAVEAIFTILAIRHNTLPPSLNIKNLEDEFSLDFVTNEARQIPSGVNVAVTNSFGFGGTNATLVFAKI
ncbi:Mitochondrial beta-keto-acyl synthase [Nowakowskiella sp. JEL0078]|nr:Mitochondrial beta-keto-acyl synthase [Nowakowskiella sp. JEL0078]